MADEATILRALNSLTVAPESHLESLSAGARSDIRALRRVLDDSNVVAVGISDKSTQGRPVGVLSLTFYVNHKKPLSQLKAQLAIPRLVPAGADAIAAIPTDVVPVGRPRLEGKQLVPPLVTRTPVQPGFSVGHLRVEGGTLGAVVSRNGRYFLLSNSHVLANSGRGKAGDVILYPARADKGKSTADRVATLAGFVRFQVGRRFVNHVDCAVAKPLTNRLDELTSVIKGLVVPSGVTRAVRGMKVVKVGRTTGKTYGKVKDAHFRLILNYPGVGQVGYRDQVFCTRFTDNGDSGALVLESGTKKAVGLHFAGFPDEHGVKGSVFNPIDKVLKRLRVELVTQDIV
jgi:hypothetical protein